MFERSDLRISAHFVSFCILCIQLVVIAIIMIDSSTIRKLLVGVEVQSPYIIERNTTVSNKLI